MPRGPQRRLWALRGIDASGKEGLNFKETALRRSSRHFGIF